MIFGHLEGNMSRILMERHKRRKRDGGKRDGLGCPLYLSYIYSFIYLNANRI